MHEEILNIPTSDGKQIRCVYNAPNGKNIPKKALLIAHGLTSSVYDYIHQQARNYFTKKGYAIYRIAFYNLGENYRNLVDCTLQTHAEDLNTAYNYIRPKHQKLYIAGHSYGGITTLMANPKAEALAFWDSSYRLQETLWRAYITPIENTPYCTLGNGITPLISKEMAEEGCNFTRMKEDTLAQHIKTPSLLVGCGHDSSIYRNNALYKALDCKKELIFLKNADHSFTYKNTAIQLMQKTYTWFEKF